MSNNKKFYIDGAWIEPLAAKSLDVVNPATEEPVAQISLGSAKDVDRAVRAARAAFPSFAATSVRERMDLLRRIVAGYEARSEDIVAAITTEMGAPTWFSRQVQTNAALDHFKQTIEVLKDYRFVQMMGGTEIRREPIGVCGFITAWNWPLNLVTAKLASALAAGCTVVAKPSEVAPLSNIILAEILHEAGVPKGVYNLVNGDGPTVGAAICAHPGIDMISFTGSTMAGILVAKTSAETVKRVHQELGGKSANIILPDADLEQAVELGVLRSFTNTGQSCQAPTRMLVHKAQLDEVKRIAKRVSDAVTVGNPAAESTRLGPVVNQAQYDKVQRLIASGIDEGATLISGGLGRPAGLNRGYYVKPTVFADVKPYMTIAQEEIFGPVLSILSYESEDEAVEIANGTIYGLAGYVHSQDIEHAKRIAARLRAGRIYINMVPSDAIAPFGGYKQSGNGREVGVFGLEEFMEVKAVLGAAAG